MMLHLFPEFHRIKRENASLRRANADLLDAIGKRDSERASALSEIEALKAETKQHWAAIERERLEAAERESYWKDRAVQIEAKYEAAAADAIKARETVTDFISQIHFGRKVYDHAPVLPDKKPDLQPILKQRMQARMAVQQAERQFSKDLDEYRARQAKARQQAMEQAGMAPAEPEAAAVAAEAGQ